MGGGLLTALQADIRVAAEDAQFGIPAARLGLGYGFGGTQKLVQTVGATAAREILFTGGRFPAEDALRWGLVNRVVPVEALEPTVTRIADAIAENAPLTVDLLRASIVEATKDPDKRDLATIEEMVEACFASEDYIEGRRAFMGEAAAHVPGAVAAWRSVCGSCSRRARPCSLRSAWTR